MTLEAYIGMGPCNGERIRLDPLFSLCLPSTSCGLVTHERDFEGKSHIYIYIGLFGDYLHWPNAHQDSISWNLPKENTENCGWEMLTMY